MQFLLKMPGLDELWVLLEVGANFASSAAWLFYF